MIISSIYIIFTHVIIINPQLTNGKLKTKVRLLFGIFQMEHGELHQLSNIKLTMSNSKVMIEIFSIKNCNSCFSYSLYFLILFRFFPFILRTKKKQLTLFYFQEMFAITWESKSSTFKSNTSFVSDIQKFLSKPTKIHNITSWLCL